MHPMHELIISTAVKKQTNKLGESLFIEAIGLCKSSCVPEMYTCFPQASMKALLLNH